MKYRRKPTEVEAGNYVILAIHAAGMFGGSGKRRTWCGRLVNDDQLPIIGTMREINCRACARSSVAKDHAARWGYSYQRRWRKLLGINTMNRRKDPTL